MEQSAGEDIAGACAQPAKDQRGEDDEGLPPLQGDDRVSKGEEHGRYGQTPAESCPQELEAIWPEEIIEAGLHVAAVEEFLGVAHAEQLVEDLQPEVVGEAVPGAEPGVRRAERQDLAGEPVERPTLAVVVAENEDGVDQHHQKRQPAKRGDKVWYREAEWFAALPPQGEGPAPSLRKEDVGIDDEVVPVLSDHWRVQENEGYQHQPVTRQTACIYDRLDNPYHDG